MLFLILACTPEDEGKIAVKLDTAITDSQPTAPQGSAGCGKPHSLTAGGLQQSLDAGREGDGTRGYWLSLPENYDPERLYSVVIGYPGTDWVGEQIQPYLNLEQYAKGDMIFVYPDPLWRDFAGWGNYGGWLLGPHASPADGMEDLVFTEALMDDLEANYCIDSSKIFVTGHSWGGDMAAVVACFLGDRVRAAIPIAANEPYWFRPQDGSTMTCPGTPAIWTFFGIADDHFTWQDYAGQFGDEQDAFWAEENGCGENTQDLNIDNLGTCIEHQGCSTPTRYCLYGPETGHQAPMAYAETAMDWFYSF